MEQVAGLWKKVTGQAAKEARFAEEQRQRTGKEAARAAQERAAADEQQKVISIAIQKPAVALNPDFDADTEVERIAGNIQAIELMGKFYPVSINGKQFTGNTGNVESRWYGDREQMSGNETRYPYLSLLSSLASAATKALQVGRFSEIGADIVTALNLPDDHGVFSYTFHNDFFDAGNRTIDYCQINFLLPKEDAFQLVDVIRAKPDNLESFIQVGAQGFSDYTRQSGEARLRGIKRTPSDGVTVVNLDKFDPGYFTNMGYSDSNAMLAQVLANNPNGQVDRYQYSKPRT